MSGPDRDASQDSESKLSPEPSPEVLRERIAQELAALGEEPLEPSDEGDAALEFALAGGSPQGDLDVATLQTLAGWAEPPETEQASDADALSELAQARVWRTIELRGKSSRTGPEAKPEAEGSPGRSTRPVLLAVVALFAVAAGVVLVPVLTADKPDLSKKSPVAQAPASITAEELDVLSTQARAGLAALDRLSGEPTGTARVEALASDYAERLEALGPGPRGSQG